MRGSSVGIKNKMQLIRDSIRNKQAEQVLKMAFNHIVRFFLGGWETHGAVQHVYAVWYGRRYSIQGKAKEKQRKSRKSWESGKSNSYSNSAKCNSLPCRLKSGFVLRSVHWASLMAQSAVSSLDTESSSCQHLWQHLSRPGFQPRFWGQLPPALLKIY